MAGFRISPEAAAKLFASKRYDVLGKLGIDVSTIGTWDERLSRRTRILVPVDVQAYVVREADPEPTVGLRGAAGDPAPFDPGTPKPPGVHLHWALPDALLSGGHDEATGGPVMPVLPDQWVVVRTLQPVGRAQVVATGWVVDARVGTVVELPQFAGPVTPAPDAETLFDPLDGLRGGPGWTASYTASGNRFAWHDRLTDLATLRDATAPQGFAEGQAVYTVAGWWSDPAHDPLTGARGPVRLQEVLDRLAWRADHDQDDVALKRSDPRMTRLMQGKGLSSPRTTARTTVVGGDGRVLSGALDNVEFATAYPVDEVGSVVHGESLTSYHCLLHGSVMGVPVEGPLPASDDRPDAGALDLAIGSDLDDVVAAFGAGGLRLDPDHRRAAEDLLAAFSAGLVSGLGTADGLDTLGQREHESGFSSLPGTSPAAARPDRLRREDSLPAGPMTVGRSARGAAAQRPEKVPALTWRTKARLGPYTGSVQTRRGRLEEEEPRITKPGAQAAEARTVVRPAPRLFRPAPFLLAVRGAHPSHRHHGDGLFDDRGRLLCRYPEMAVKQLDGVVSGAAVLPGLGSGAIPEEVLTVVREAVLLNPYGYQWLAEAGGHAAKTPVLNRVAAEMVRLYGVDGTYDSTGHVEVVEAKATSAWAGAGLDEQHRRRQLAAELARLSVLRGVPPSPVAVTTWRQPWVPLWVEWRVTLEGGTSLDGWQLDGYDLEADETTPPADTMRRTLVGRSLLGAGVGEKLRAAVTDWRRREAQREVTNRSSAYGDGVVVQQLSTLDQPLDLVSASLDGIREQLLGIEYVGQVERAGGEVPASSNPVPFFGGRLRLDAARLVDAFGRLLDVPDAALDALSSTLELELEGQPRTIRMRPRLQGSARWLWRLVDAKQVPATSAAELREAFVDQLDPSAAVNPVAGFLLPDHIDESLETFTVGGDPIGEVGHDAVTGSVGWEPAPGRPVPPDAGPFVGTGAQEQYVAHIAAGLVRADAAARASASPPEVSALTAFLRAVDSTLWLVDTFSSLGSSTLAGLVGRPIAVVRTSLALDAPDDLGEVSPEGDPALRKAAFDALVELAFEAQLGTLNRADDSLLGYFVDDDYEHLHLVDKVVAEEARRSGRQTGHLGVLGSADQTGAPERQPVAHPYLVTDRPVRVRRGQTVMLTLLMLPGGRAHLTSGVLPRKDLQLADSWFTPGLKRLMPSVRVGPLLVDPDEIRLPLVSALGEDQTFTRRTGELAWKDDPILAATQTAYLPRAPHEVQEGWIRVTPPEAGGDA